MTERERERERESLQIITHLVHKVSGKDIEISINQDLRKDEILDSLDLLVFFMELEKETGIVVPDTPVLVKDGWYKVSKICFEIMEATKSQTPA